MLTHYEHTYMNKPPKYILGIETGARVKLTDVSCFENGCISENFLRKFPYEAKFLRISVCVFESLTD